MFFLLRIRYDRYIMIIGKKLKLYQRLSTMHHNESIESVGLSKSSLGVIIHHVRTLYGTRSGQNERNYNYIQPQHGVIYVVSLKVISKSCRNITRKMNSQIFLQSVSSANNIRQFTFNF